MIFKDRDDTLMAGSLNEHILKLSCFSNFNDK